MKRLEAIPREPNEHEKAILTLPKGSIIYVILRHVSRNGTLRVIEPIIVINNEIWRLFALDKLNWSYDNDRSGYILKGCGMDMGYDLVYHIGLKYHNDGYYFTMRWL